VIIYFGQFGATFVHGHGYAFILAPQKLVWLPTFWAIFFRSSFGHPGMPHLNRFLSNDCFHLFAVIVLSKGAVSNAWVADAKNVFFLRIDPGRQSA
jgi:hypothetical protein